MSPNDALILTTQLIQMNERARWYAGQIWQLPLSYLGISFALIANVADKGENLLRALLVCLSAIGFGVVFQLMWLYEGNRRAVLNIQAMEVRLGLDITAQHHPWTTFTMIGLTILISTSFLVGAIFINYLAVKKRA
jgi:hypothetical protein